MPTTVLQGPPGFLDLRPCLVKAAVYEKFKKMHPKVPSEIMFRAFFLSRFLASLGTVPMLRQQKNWVGS